MQPDLQAEFAFEISAACDRVFGRPFVTGVDDCVLWVGGIYARVLGFDPVAEWRNRYSTREQALALCGHLGIAGAFLKATKALGWQPIPVTDAQVGDFGLTARPDTTFATIFDGVWWWGRAPVGCRALPLRSMTRAWRPVARAEEP